MRERSLESRAVIYGGRSKEDQRRHHAGRGKTRKSLFLRTACLSAAVLCIVFAATIHISGSSESEIAAEEADSVSYMTIRVSEGDTLWSIADEYMGPEYESREEYIETVMEINDVYDGNIHAGSYLVIPCDGGEGTEMADIY